LLDPRDERVTSKSSVSVSQELHWESNLLLRRVPEIFRVGRTKGKHMLREEETKLFTRKQTLLVIA
jgi:hypothetical protein